MERKKRAPAGGSCAAPNGAGADGTYLVTAARRQGMAGNAGSGCAADRAKTHEEAFEAGFKAGYDKGHKAGLTEGRKAGRVNGLTKGHEEGHKEGREEGRKEGRDEGFKAGHDEGFSEGYAKGYAEGRAAGLRESQSVICQSGPASAVSAGTGTGAAGIHAASDGTPGILPAGPAGQEGPLEQACQPCQDALAERHGMNDALFLAAQARPAWAAEAGCAAAEPAADKGNAGAGSAPGCADDILPGQHGAAEAEAAGGTCPAPAPGDGGAPGAPGQAETGDSAGSAGQAAQQSPLPLPAGGAVRGGLAGRLNAKALLLWPLALPLAFGCGAGCALGVDAWLQDGPAEERPVCLEETAYPAPAAMRPGAPAAERAAGLAPGAGLAAQPLEALAERLAGVLARPLERGQGQDCQRSGALAEGRPGSQGRQESQDRQARTTLNSNRTGPSGKVSQSGTASTASTASTSSQNSQTGQNGQDGLTGPNAPGTGDSRAAASAPSGSVQEGDGGAEPPSGAGGIPQPAGPAGSLGETARLIGEAEAVKLRTRLAREEAACLKAQIETARLRRELAETGTGRPAGGMVPQARTAAAAAGPAGPLGASASAGRQASAGSAGARAEDAPPAATAAPQAARLPQPQSLGRIVSIQDIGGTLTAAVRLPSGSLAMLRPGSRWAGGRVVAVTPRGLRLKLGSRTAAVPF